MTRRLLNLLSILSLLLFVATAALWVRGKWASDILLYVTGGTRTSSQTIWMAGNGAGGIALLVFHGSGSDIDSPGQPLGYQRRQRRPQYAGMPPEWASVVNRPGFAWFAQESNPYGGQQGTFGVIVPAWSVLTLLAAFPVARLLLHLRRRRRFRAGTCPRCGYDLRATPGRCPECGWSETPAGGKATSGAGVSPAS